MNDQHQLESWLQKWQKIMRLQDWDIQIKFVRAFEMPDRQGQVNWLLAKKRATISILTPGDYDQTRGWAQDIEKTIVHELVHVHFAPIDKTSGLEEALLEQAVDLLACALIDRDRLDKRS